MHVRSHRQATRELRGAAPALQHTSSGFSLYHVPEHKTNRWQQSAGRGGPGRVYRGVSLLHPEGTLGTAEGCTSRGSPQPWGTGPAGGASVQSDSGKADSWTPPSEELCSQEAPPTFKQATPDVDWRQPALHGGLSAQHQHSVSTRGQMPRPRCTSGHVQQQHSTQQSSQ